MGQDTSSQALGKPLHYARGCTVPGCAGLCRSRWTCCMQRRGVAQRSVAWRGAAASTEDPREAGCRWLPGKGQPCRISSFPSLRPEKEAADAALAVAVRRGVAPSLRATGSNLRPGSSIPSGHVPRVTRFRKKGWTLLHKGVEQCRGPAGERDRTARPGPRCARLRPAPPGRAGPLRGLHRLAVCSQPSLAGCTPHGRVRGHSVRVHADHDNGSVRCAFLRTGTLYSFVSFGEKIEWKENFFMVTYKFSDNFVTEKSPKSNLQIIIIFLRL